MKKQEEKQMGDECNNCGEKMFSECFLHGAYCEGCNGDCETCQLENEQE